MSDLFAGRRHRQRVVDHPWFSDQEKRTILPSWVRDELVKEQVARKALPESSRTRRSMLEPLRSSCSCLSLRQARETGARSLPPTSSFLKWGEGSGPAGAGTDEIRASRQSENRKSARSNRGTIDPRPRRRGDRITGHQSRRLAVGPCGTGKSRPLMWSNRRADSPHAPGVPARPPDGEGRAGCRERAALSCPQRLKKLGLAEERGKPKPAAKPAKKKGGRAARL